MMKNGSYQQIRETFDILFPEFKHSVKDWVKDGFTNVERFVRIILKNGCAIRFGSIREDDGGWTYMAFLQMSDKTHDKLGFVRESEITEE